ncbi:four-carbon acid sugar kinase family protein [Pinibacter soli]|uniref:Four-carbon acid sugar kinase family protein n=1 Tax=Pinibacter soli TaxID=3044211 RepID=A0ABT6REY5_9BACT|nr:four-carbon acid sugar kinase family protein [Pinibacter soli]MDI3320955.1 four-carbon acid sugar kinase family protein [Pinibacter soli]
MLTVIADDITGAAEIAGICLSHGVSVTFDFEAKEVPDTMVWIIATNTRSLPEDKAVDEISRIGKFLQRKNIVDVFKKIDSALRGFVIPETKTLLQFIPKEKTFVLSANPDTGRVIKNGHYYINGVALNETSFASDPDFPARSSSVNEILHLTQKDADYFLTPDITRTEDYAIYAAQLNESTLPIGSSVFFEAILEINYPQFHKCITSMSTGFMKAKHTLMIAGSTHENSIQFVEKARKYFAVFELPVQWVEHYPPDIEIEKWADKIAETIQKEGPAIITSKRDKIQSLYAKQIERLYAAAAGRILSRTPVDELYIEGGATAWSILNALGYSSFTPVGEYARGVVRMQVESKKQLFLTIKPGSYLWPEIIL